jgi:hypothetical protein
LDEKKEEEESSIIGFFSFNKLLLFLYEPRKRREEEGRGGKRKTKGREVLVLSFFERGFEIGGGSLGDVFFLKGPSTSSPLALIISTKILLL